MGSRFADGGNVTGIVEWIALVGGMEKGKFLPSVSSMVGARTASGLEFAVGPNLSLSGIAMVFGVGYNFKSGNLNIPVNIAFVPGRKRTYSQQEESYEEYVVTTAYDWGPDGIYNTADDIQEVGSYETIIERESDIVITEGAGGWRLPLGEGKFLSQFAQQTKQKVILVVNMKLGCLNHALLTYETILADGLECIGWIANCAEPMNYLEENIAELRSLIDSPLIAKLGFEADINKAVSVFNLSSITKLL